ncbi:hypothetical protein DFQ26_004037 [Actinomortierella ambigua]|nr:hypothetical protein DFQ26_004037 [Actinomortierella ambigua]
MARLGRRGIVLSLFINALNIALYIIIFIAACFNIIEASVNFIILNGSAIFGCLVATPIPFNLYGGIVVVCMGLAFFIMSFITLIPPLDGLMLNYRKLDEWREQRHFRIQLEAQRIYEQQLQQEQAFAGLIPHHLHTNGLSTQGGSGGGGGGGSYSTHGKGSPKPYRHFRGGGLGKALASSGPTAALKSIFSPPMNSPNAGAADHSDPSAVESHVVPLQHISMMPKGMMSGEYTEVVLESVEDKKQSLSVRISSAAGIGRMRDRSVGSVHELLGGGSGVASNIDSSLGQVAETPVSVDKELPPIVTKATIEHPTYAVPTTFTLTPTTTPAPSTPLRSGNTTPYPTKINEDTRDYLHSTLGTGGGSTDGPVAAPGRPTPLNLKLTHSYKTDAEVAASARLGGSQHLPFSNPPSSSYKSQATPKSAVVDYPLPLRLNNKPAPPYDPFRKVNHHAPSQNSAHTAVSYTATTPTVPTPTTSVIASISQSIYQPPEPPRAIATVSSAGQTIGYGRGPDSSGGRGSAGAGLPVVDQGAYYRPTPDMAVGGVREPTAVTTITATTAPTPTSPPLATTMPATSTSAIAQRDSGSQVHPGGYGMVGIATYATKPPTTVPYPRPPNFSHKPYQQQLHHFPPPPQQQQQQQRSREEQPLETPQFQFQVDEPEDHNDMAPTMPGHGQEQNYRPGGEWATATKTKSPALTRVRMPDIVLTLPTPGETYGGGHSGGGYFSMG